MPKDLNGPAALYCHKQPRQLTGSLKTLWRKTWIFRCNPWRKLNINHPHGGTSAGQIISEVVTMLNQETLNKLNHMKLTGMVEARKQQEMDPSYREMDFQERIGLLVDWEFNKRQHNRLQRLIRSAKFQDTTAYVEDIGFRDDRHLDRHLWLPVTTSHTLAILLLWARREPESRIWPKHSGKPLVDDFCPLAMYS